MHVRFKTDGVTAWFVLADVEQAYHETVRGLSYAPVEEGFAKWYPADTPDLDRIYRHFERSAQAMVQQAARAVPVAWEDTLEMYLELIGGHGLDWCLVGSAALAVRGMDVQPGDVDVVTDGRGAERLNELLRDWRVEPLQRSEGWIWRSFGRAFLGGRLEWVGGVNERADQPMASDFGPMAWSRAQVVRWRGVEIKVPPLDLQLAVSERRGMADRAAKIREHLLTCESDAGCGLA